MTKRNLSLATILILFSDFAYAQATEAQSTSLEIAKVVFGLIVVLACIAALAWLMKKLTVSKGGRSSVARIVGGVSVGTRERVVVLEIANRWIVVGVAPGRVSAIANLDIEPALETASPLPPHSGEGFMENFLASLKKRDPSTQTRS
jgi:flagellar protein FliO/FliZ